MTETETEAQELVQEPAGKGDQEDRLVAEGEIAGDYLEELPRLAALGVMRPHVSHRFPLEQAADAFRVLMDRKVVGKVAIEMTR